MNIRFDTTEYELSHGRKPRGFGMWAFRDQYRNRPAGVHAGRHDVDGRKALGAQGAAGRPSGGGLLMTGYTHRMPGVYAASGAARHDRGSRRVARGTGGTRAC